jgi:hypothetical protein
MSLVIVEWQFVTNEDSGDLFIVPSSSYRIESNMIASFQGSVDRSTLCIGVALTLIFYMFCMMEDWSLFNLDSSRIRLTTAHSSSSIFLKTYPKMLSSSTDATTTTSLKNLPRLNEKSVIPLYFKSDFKYCSIKNEILDRGDNYGTFHESKQPYSLSSYTFATFHYKLKCSSLPETLRAIKYGTRKWLDPSKQNAPSLVREKFKSYFIPYRCDLPYLSSHDACSIMSQFSHIFTIGDSFTRHLRQALLITLRRDLILGGIETRNKYNNDNPFDCRCDGQFSEHAHCRQNDHFFDSMSPRDLNICSELTDEDQFHFNFEWNWTSVDCSQVNTKPVLLLLQGGAHFATDVKPTMDYFVIPHMDHPNIRQCMSQKKLRVIWIDFTAQSRSLDNKYPHQSRENALEFNKKMNRKVQEAIPGVTIIDWWNLTADAQTSDGLHFLTDVNLQKANHFLHVINYLAEL